MNNFQLIKTNSVCSKINFIKVTRAFLLIPLQNLSNLFSIKYIPLLCTIWLSVMSFYELRAQCNISLTGGTLNSAFLAYTGQTFTTTCAGSISQITFDADAAKPYGIEASIRVSTCDGTILGTGNTVGNVSA